MKPPDDPSMPAAPAASGATGAAPVPAFDYRPGQAAIQDELDAAVARVMASGQLILGPEVAAFETEFAAWVHAAAAVGVNSGTDALILALRVLGIGPGDEVITVANAGSPPVAAICATGARPRFVDVDARTLLLDPERLPAALGPRTRAVVPVHLYGQAAPLAPILAFAERHGLHVIEDCAQAHGTTYRGRHVGTFGALGCFSFYPTKNLGACGDGGAIVTQDLRLAERLHRLRMYGFDERRVSRHPGLNSRLDELQAAILRVKLRHLDAAVTERRRLADRYLALLTDGAQGAQGARGLKPADGATTSCTPVTLAAESEHAWHLFVVRSRRRAAAIAALSAAWIGHGVHYPVAAHLMPAWSTFGAAPGSLPCTEAACASVLSLPLYPGLPDGTPERVAAALADGTGTRGHGA